MADKILGSKTKSQQQGRYFAQVERAALEQWSALIGRQPTAGQVLALLVANMGSQNAIVISQAVLAKLTGKSLATVKRALLTLQAERWIQAVALGKGKEKAYVVNSRVAWGQPRKQLVLSKFDAAIVANRDDQDELALDETPLRQIPTLYEGEHQVPHGPGADPPVQTLLEGMEPDLPTRKPPASEKTFFDDFMQRGPTRYPELHGDPTTEKGESK